MSVYVYFIIFFYKQKTAYEMCISDWSSVVCSSDLMHTGASDASHHSTPAEMGHYMGSFDETPGFQPLTHGEESPSGSPSRRKSPHRRTESVARDRKSYG